MDIGQTDCVTDISLCHTGAPSKTPTTCSSTFNWPSSNICSDLLCMCLGLRCIAISKKTKTAQAAWPIRTWTRENFKMKRVCNMTLVTLLPCAKWPSCIAQRNYSLAGTSQAYLWNTTIIFPEQNNTLCFASNANTLVEKNPVPTNGFYLKIQGWISHLKPNPFVNGFSLAGFFIPTYAQNTVSVWQS